MNILASTMMTATWTEAIVPVRHGMRPNMSWILRVARAFEKMSNFRNIEPRLLADVGLAQTDADSTNVKDFH